LDLERTSDLNDLTIYGDENLIFVDYSHGIPMPILNLCFLFEATKKKQISKFSRFIEDTKSVYADYQVMKIDMTEVSKVDLVEAADSPDEESKYEVHMVHTVSCSIANYTCTYKLQEMIDWALIIIEYYKELVKDIDEDA